MKVADSYDLNGPRGLAEQAVEYLEEVKPPEHQWLFTFAGWLKGGGMRGKDGEATAADHYECLRFFAREVQRRMHPSGKVLRWNDFEAVTLEFDKAWEKRKFPEASVFFYDAVLYSQENLLELQGLNGWVVRMVNLAFLLQEEQPGLPFLIPVNVETADMLNTSIRTLSLALARAVELDFVRVEEEAKMKGSRRFARRLTFNYEHPGVVAGLEAARDSVRTI